MAEDKNPVPIRPEAVEATRSLGDILENIRDPKHWIETEALIAVIKDNPSLRGMIYGYVAEAAFSNFLDGLGIKEHFKPDDHKKTKSDRSFVYHGRLYTVQLKSVQTNMIKELEPGKFAAKVQNDASDKRTICFTDGTTLQTTCYQVGEYDVLGVSLQPFCGTWRFAFKKNKDLKRSTYRGYSSDVQNRLLATLEDISFPLGGGWTEDLISVLKDPDLGVPIKK